MFTRTLKLFDPQAAPTSSGTPEYTCPNATRCRLGKVTATNSNDTTVRELTAYIVPSGGSAGDTNVIIDAYSIGPNQTVTLADLIGHVLEEGDALDIIVDTGTDVILHATGTEVTI